MEQTFPEVQEAVTTRVVDEFKVVPVGSVCWKNELRNFTREDIINMGASLMVHGQIELITVKPANAEGLYEGVVGRKRYEGAKHAHIQTVLARIRKFSGPDEELEWQLAENLHRTELSALKRAESYGKLAGLRKKRFPEEAVVEGIAMSLEGLTGTRPAAQTVRKYLEIDARIGKHAKTTSLMREGETASLLKISHLEQVSRLEDDDKQAELLSYTILEGWTAQKLKHEVDVALGIVKPSADKVLHCGVCDSTLPSGDFETFKVCGMCSAEFLTWLQERKENLQNSADLSLQKSIEPSPAEATQQIMCQTCRVSLLLVHNADGTHKILVKQRKV
jgi:ParB-like chromosome segregation protein Spo0J